MIIIYLSCICHYKTLTMKWHISNRGQRFQQSTKLTRFVSITYYDLYKINILCQKIE